MINTKDVYADIRSVKFESRFSENGFLCKIRLSMSLIDFCKYNAVANKSHTILICDLKYYLSDIHVITHPTEISKCKITFCAISYDVLGSGIKPKATIEEITEILRKETKLDKVHDHKIKMIPYNEVIQ